MTDNDVVVMKAVIWLRQDGETVKHRVTDVDEGSRRLLHIERTLREVSDFQTGGRQWSILVTTDEDRMLRGEQRSSHVG